MISSPQRNAMSFPIATLPERTIRASFDLDPHEHGVWTLESPVCCPACETFVTKAQPSRLVASQQDIALCPRCMAFLANVEAM